MRSKCCSEDKEQENEIKSIPIHLSKTCLSVTELCDEVKRVLLETCSEVTEQERR
jgi:hypothetical protein